MQHAPCSNHEHPYSRIPLLSYSPVKTLILVYKYDSMQSNFKSQ